MKIRNKPKKSFFKENYAGSWKYIRESKNFIYSVLIIFFLFVLVGSFIPIPEVLEQKILKIIEELLRQTENLSAGELIKFIFLNNLQSSFLGLFLGVGLGIFSLITGIVNGYILGFVMLKSVQANGALVLWKLFPHGIFELPALFISLGLGMKLGMFILEKDKIVTLKKYLSESARVFIFVILPLLFIAAIIEGSLIFLFK